MEGRYGVVEENSEEDDIGTRERYMKGTVFFTFFIFRSDRIFELQNSQNTKQLCTVYYRLLLDRYWPQIYMALLIE